MSIHEIEILIIMIIEYVTKFINGFQMKLLIFIKLLPDLVKHFSNPLVLSFHKNR